MTCEARTGEVALCGLYCGLCASRRRIPELASRLSRALVEEGYDQGYYDIPGLQERFPAFWDGLRVLATAPCVGCRGGGGNPGCAIRQCALERQVVACPYCSEFPCERLDALRAYPLYRSDAERLRSIGIEAWAGEQEGRSQAGFCYADVRHRS